MIRLQRTITASSTADHKQHHMLHPGRQTGALLAAKCIELKQLADSAQSLTRIRELFILLEAKQEKINSEAPQSPEKPEKKGIFAA